MRHHKYTPSEGEVVANHNEDKQHHENHPYVVKNHVHLGVKQSTSWRPPSNKAIENRLSHENTFNGQLLEKAITLERQGTFTIAMLRLLSIEFEGEFINGDCIVLKHINYVMH